MTYEKDVPFLGLTTKKFVLGPDNFARPSDNKENICFVSEPNDTNAQFSGLVDVSPCVQHLPVVYSQPHFYQASSELLDQFTNLAPNKTIHETYALIESSIGFSLKGRKALQLNIDLDAVIKTKIYSSLSPTLFPILWFALGGQVDHPTADYLYQQVYQTPQKIANIISIASISACLTTALLFISILIVVSHR